MHVPVRREHVERLQAKGEESMCGRGREKGTLC